MTARTSDGERPEAAFLLRAFWMLLGNATLVVLALSIALADRPVLSLTSLAFCVVAGLVVYARHLDVTRFEGTTSEGDRRATPADVKRFGKWQLVASGATLALVHAI